LVKLLFSFPSPALSGTAVAFTSKRSILRSETKGFHGREREELEAEDKDHDRRGKTTLLESGSCRFEEEEEKARIGSNLEGSE
jgi:ribosome assembly protein YihI (activator of Der GTPase)